jgi:hypothetical protein
MNNSEMGWTCGTFVREERCIRGLEGKAKDKRQLGSPRSRWEDNIKIDLQDTGCKSREVG